MTAVRPPTPAEETALRVLLHADADRVEPSPGAYSRIRSRRLVALLGLVARTFAARPDGWDQTTTQNGAPGWNPGTPPTSAAHLEGHTAMTIIQRHARDLHAGDIITADPDHHNRPVRWRVTRPPVLTSDGEYALADYTDLESDGHGIAYYRILTDLPVEPAGGAA